MRDGEIGITADSGSVVLGSSPSPAASISYLHMDNATLQKLNKEELDFIFSSKGSGVRRATVISAYIEWQIFYLASIFLKSRNVAHDPEPMQEYRQSLNVLKTNKILGQDELKNLEEFRKQRNISIHGIFKGMTRDQWNQQNQLVIELGRPIVKRLNERLEKGLN